MEPAKGVPAAAPPGVQQMAPQGGAPVPVMMIPAPAGKPNHEQTPLILLLASILCCPCLCPCATVYYVIEEQEYSKKRDAWNHKQEAERQTDRAFMMQQMPAQQTQMQTPQPPMPAPPPKMHAPPPPC